MHTYYKKAVVGCATYKDPQACQLLANLCVLTFYNNKPESPCGHFERLVDEPGKANAYPRFYDDEGWKTALPWLTYRQKATEVI